MSIIKKKMTQKIVIVCSLILLISCNSETKESNKTVNAEKTKNETTKSVENKFAESYFIEKTFILDLDYDTTPDTLQLIDIKYTNTQTKKTFDDHGYRRISISNKLGKITIDNLDAWGNEIECDSIDNIILDNKEYNFKVVAINKNSTGLIFSKYLYGSDYDYHTIITVDSTRKPTVCMDSTIRIKAFRDIDKDGNNELIGILGYDNIYRLGFISNSPVTDKPYHILTYINRRFENNDSLFYSYNSRYYGFREFPESSLKKLTDYDLQDRNRTELRLMRNEIFAQYGYVFNSKDLQDYFSAKEWYNERGNGEFQFCFTENEKYNIDLIKKFEE